MEGPNKRVKKCFPIDIMNPNKKFDDIELEDFDPEDFPGSDLDLTPGDYPTDGEASSPDDWEFCDEELKAPNKGGFVWKGPVNHKETDPAVLVEGAINSLRSSVSFRTYIISRIKVLLTPAASYWRPQYTHTKYMALAQIMGRIDKCYTGNGGPIINEIKGLIRQKMISSSSGIIASNTHYERLTNTTRTHDIYISENGVVCVISSDSYFPHSSSNNLCYNYFKADIEFKSEDAEIFRLVNGMSVEGYSYINFYRMIVDAIILARKTRITPVYHRNYISRITLYNEDPGPKISKLY